MKLIFSILLFAGWFSLCVGQNQIKFYEDTAKMKQEVLGHIPIGTDIEHARQIMQEGKFSFVGAYVNEPFMYGGNLDFLFFMHDEGVIFCMNRWKVALVHKNEKVTGVQVQFVIICL